MLKARIAEKIPWKTYINRFDFIFERPEIKKTVKESIAGKRKIDFIVEKSM
jgi:hypothetical protein